MSADTVTLPPSTATVSVSILNVARLDCPAVALVHPVLPGHERLVVPVFAFLIEHGKNEKARREMFNLGVRKDPEGFAPAVRNMLQRGAFGMHVEANVATLLAEGGVKLESVDAIIWSISQWLTYSPSTGDPSTFPSSTELVIGPGTKDAFFPPYPKNPDSTLLASDFQGRKVTELTTEDFTLSIGGFAAYDYFGDGSFYLLDTPGHCPGHITALARVTPTSFIFMGGDTCHHPGQFRPSTHMPCPCSRLSSISHEHFPHVASSTSTGTPLAIPLLTVPFSPPSVYTDPVRAVESIARLSAFDAHPDVLVLLAHDRTVEDVVRYFPEKADKWKENGWKEKRWAFLERGGRAWRFSPA
ncbi:hypothetical protein NEOLEDRAFT_1222530 [Neolentinus lepideus HHB14362 ss-1]|uniref:Metallo-beta-lactamase domain-containing protein n=1 Tax=Neolentinus lepideus HHB14362 ss-1 TaxID=1314782 RepID=A0A165PVI7_9AGAM|nr:hypothetical protein NEOLEDRAFT_1222530 [Neolentinus lepideus HHB14362 ss-1]